MMTKDKKSIIWIVIIATLFSGYFVADFFLSDEIAPRAIHENDFQGNYFAMGTIEKKAAVILIGGGQWGDYWAQEIAKKDYVGFSLPFIRREGLPDLPEEINLEYFEKALIWLKNQKEVDPRKIIVMGASRNAELSLVLASVFPDHISGVIAYAPSSVSWSNTVLPYNSDELKPSWKYSGADIPYIPMDKIVGNETNKLETLEYWENGLAKIKDYPNAVIKVENINGPILLLSGIDDEVWPSAMMANMIEKRLIDHDFKFPFQNIQYENAGHLVSTHPNISSGIRTGKLKVNNKEYDFDFGGTDEGDQKAKLDAQEKIFKFIDDL